MPGSLNWSDSNCSLLLCKEERLSSEDNSLHGVQIIGARTISSVSQKKQPILIIFKHVKKELTN